MAISVDLVINAAIAGLLLGVFYAAVAAGASISFGLLDIVNIAHPAFVIVGAYAAYLANQWLHLDPILAGIVLSPAFYGLGLLIYQVYHWSFERHGGDTMRGLAFFFGIMFVTEVALTLTFGVNYRYVSASYVTTTYHLGPIGLPMRLIVPFAASLVLLGCMYLYLAKTFNGRAILGVSQDQMALRLLSIDPDKLKSLAFAMSIASAGIVGSLLIIVQPVEPFAGREFIGRVFAIIVLGGMGSVPGAVIAAILLGIVENMTSIVIGASWAPAVSFSFLLLTLAVRPTGLLGR
ncbi:MAG: branched-chain amino acid ABC transporter permease [Xanthobacteraceae bacterium]